VRPITGYKLFWDAGKGTMIEQPVLECGSENFTFVTHPNTVEPGIDYVWAV
jgi:hypothetical protein